MKYINKITPAYDKLKHFFIGTLAFIGLSIFFINYVSLLILLVGVSFWEVAQKLKKGKNNLKEMILDVLYSIFVGGVFTLINIFK